jgi:nicotinamidase-related amidase
VVAHIVKHNLAAEQPAAASNTHTIHSVGELQQLALSNTMKTKTTGATLPLPPFYDSTAVEKWQWIPPYDRLHDIAVQWRGDHAIKPAGSDRARIALMPIDNQLCFSHPDFQLYVGGRSGRGAIDDAGRLERFVYENLGRITAIHPTLDTHNAFQIFHRAFWVNGKGENPGPFTIITQEDVEKGVWSVNPAAAFAIFRSGTKHAGLQAHALHYVKKLTAGGKYPLMVWPYHAVLGGAGHCIVPALEQAFFFHNIVRGSQTDFQIKGGNPLTENYSILGPEVDRGADGKPIASANTRFIETLLNYDAVIIAGQAKSHCVAWSVRHLLDEIAKRNPELAQKVYLLEDCTSSVVVRDANGVVIYDYTDDADKVFSEFKAAGMNLVSTSTPLEQWPGMDTLLAR